MKDLVEASRSVAKPLRMRLHIDFWFQRSGRRYLGADSSGALSEAPGGSARARTGGHSWTGVIQERGSAPQPYGIMQLSESEPLLATQVISRNCAASDPSFGSRPSWTKGAFAPLPSRTLSRSKFLRMLECRGRRRSYSCSCCYPSKLDSALAPARTEGG